jgi:hypothetical protein
MNVEAMMDPRATPTLWMVLSVGGVKLPSPNPHCSPSITKAQKPTENRAPLKKRLSL